MTSWQVAFGTLVPAIVLASLVAANAARLGRALKVIDHPAAPHKTHTTPTPLIGGVAVLAGFAPALATAAWIGELPWQMFAAVFVATALGLLDDRRHLDPKLRLAAGFFMGLAAATAPLLCLTALRIAEAGALQLEDVAGVGFTALCLTALMNAVNMSDGRNGLVSGQLLVVAIVIGLSSPLMSWPMLALSGALAVVLAFNLAGKLFLGDSGSYGLSMALGLSAIAAYNATPEIDIFTVMTWFAFPVLDCARLLIVRPLAGRSPFEGGRDHLHHYLDARMDWRKALPLYLVCACVPAVCTLVLSQDWLAFAGASVAYATLYLYARPQPGEMLEAGEARPPVAVSPAE